GEAGDRWVGAVGGCERFGEPVDRGSGGGAAGGGGGRGDVERGGGWCRAAVRRGRACSRVVSRCGRPGSTAADRAAASVASARAVCDAAGTDRRAARPRARPRCPAL